jgi:ADP-ribose pyrophosphatase
MRRLIGTRRVYEGQVISVRLDDVEMPSGRRVVYEIVEHRGAVVIVPVTADGTVLMVRQFRQAVGQELLELPAGTIERGETPEACARRELAEEVGRAAARWQHLLSFFPSPGILTEEMHVFLAQDLRAAQAEREEEDLRIEPLPLREARRRIGSSDIRDAKSIVGLLLASARLEDLTPP